MTKAKASKRTRVQSKPEEREHAALLLSQGETWLATSVAVGVDKSSIFRWMQEEKFAQKVEDYKADALEDLRSHYIRNVGKAFRVQYQVLDGQVEAKNDSSVQAEKLIDRFLRTNVQRGDADIETVEGKLAQIEAPP
jgi:hypothetical protein